MKKSVRINNQLMAELEANKHCLEALEKRPEKEWAGNCLLRIFINSLSNFCCSLDANGRILQVLTRSVRPLTRVLEGRLLTEILPRPYAEKLVDELHRTFEKGEIQQFKFIVSGLTDRRWYEVKSSLAQMRLNGEKIAVFLFLEVTIQ